MCQYNANCKVRNHRSGSKQDLECRRAGKASNKRSKARKTITPSVASHKEKMAATWMDAAELLTLPLCCTKCDSQELSELCYKCDKEKETRFSILSKADELGKRAGITKQDVEMQLLSSSFSDEDKETIGKLIDSYFPSM